jgi:hypothetical protein
MLSCKGAARRALLLLSILLAASLPISAQSPDDDQFEHYLAMKQIQKAFDTGDFKGFKDISQYKISIDFEPPFELSGYLYVDKFIEDFTHAFAHFETRRIEWVSKHLEEKFAVQSLNLILKNKRSERTVFYKFIFFLTRTGKEWKIYYLKGLKL